MAGTIFDYKPGRINARFQHGSGFDTIVLRIRMSDAVVTTTPCDDQFQKGNPVNHVADRQDFSVYMTSVWCPFADLIRFLEAIVIQVRECSFDWDAEGPGGGMKWERRFINENGFLTVTWYSHYAKFEHRMMLDTRQAVRMLYTAFRRFIESPEYDFLRYEKHSMEEELVAGLGDRYSEDEIIEYMKNLDLRPARRLLNAVLQRTGYRQYINYGNQLESIEQIKQPIEFEQCLSMYGHFCNDDIDCETSDNYLSNEWSGWDLARREAELREMFLWNMGSWYGARLRDLRSTIIEDYLAKDQN